MPPALKAAWNGFVRPIFKRPDRIQVAALCTKGDGEDKKVLLVTSRGTGRWILPKGWPVAGKSAAESAAQEAWEEAGVRKAKVSDLAVGSYRYSKVLQGGVKVPCEAKVYPIEVRKLAETYPEAGERRRKWVSPQKAAKLVQEAELKHLLYKL